MLSNYLLFEDKQLPRSYQEYFDNLNYSQVPDKLIEKVLKEEKYLQRNTPIKRGIKTINDLKQYAIKKFVEDSSLFPFLLRDSNQLNSFFKELKQIQGIPFYPAPSGDWSFYSLKDKKIYNLFHDELDKRLLVGPYSIDEWLKDPDATFEYYSITLQY